MFPTRGYDSFFQQYTISTISEQEVDSIAETFEQKMAPINYNTLAPLLELSARLSQGGNWKETFENFTLSAGALLQKYRGGTTAIVAMAALEMLQEMGHFGVVIGESRTPPQVCYYPTPSPDQPRVWQAAIEHLQGYSHLVCLLPFQDENRTQRALVLRNYFTQEQNATIYPSWAKWKEEFDDSNVKPMQPFPDPIKYVKALLQIPFCFHAFSKEKNETCSLNLLDGTFSVEPGLFADLPKRLDNKACFSIQELCSLGDIDIILNEQRVRRSNAEVLALYLNAIQQAFAFPPDFQDNLIFFMQNKDRFLAEISLPPAAKLASLWQIYKQVDLLKRQAHHIIADKNRLNQADADFANAVETLTESAFLKAQHSYTQAITEIAGELQMPVSILLEQFNE